MVKDFVCIGKWDKFYIMNDYLCNKKDYLWSDFYEVIGNEVKR